MNILQTEDTICAIATAQGGAIGTIRVSGPEAITLTDRIFKPVSGKPLAERAPYTLTFGHILTPEGEIIDEVLVSLFRGILTSVRVGGTEKADQHFVDDFSFGREDIAEGESIRCASG